MNKISAIFLILFLVSTLCLSACDNFNFTETYEGKVVKILDGDSINIIQQGKEIRVRLAEIDAPEHIWETITPSIREFCSREESIG